MNLHLGCGNLKLENFINIDINSEKADLKLDIRKLDIFNNSTVEQIYNCHILEHIPRKELLNIILEWNRILKIGGILRISVPDFEQVVNIYNKNKDITQIIGFLNGGQRNQWDFHFVNFDFDFLTQLLTLCGFNNIQRYDAEEFLGNYDDYSKAYIPHMDKNGMLMSLNIVCTKEKNISVIKDIPMNIKKYLQIA